FRSTYWTAALHEPACILHNLTAPVLRSLRFWERYAVRLRWKAWDKAGKQFWHIRNAEPRASWDAAANQFLLWLAPEPFLRVDFIPGNYEANPESRYFVVGIYVGNEATQNPAIISARIFSSDEWDRSNKTLLGFR